MCEHAVYRANLKASADLAQAAPGSPNMPTRERSRQLCVKQGYHRAGYACASSGEHPFVASAKRPGDTTRLTVTIGIC